MIIITFPHAILNIWIHLLYMQRAMQVPCGQWYKITPQVQSAEKMKTVSIINGIITDTCKCKEASTACLHKCMRKVDLTKQSSISTIMRKYTWCKCKGLQKYSHRLVQLDPSKCIHFYKISFLIINHAFNHTGNDHIYFKCSFFTSSILSSLMNRKGITK
jgi:hypothetical protein